MHRACLTEVSRGVRGPASPFNCGFLGPSPRRTSVFCTLCLLETSQNPHRETGAKESGADAQQLAVGLSPVQTVEGRDWGDRAGVYRSWARKRAGSGRRSQHHRASVRNVLGWVTTNRSVRLAVKAPGRMLFYSFQALAFLYLQRLTLWEPFLDC